DSLSDFSDSSDQLGVGMLESMYAYFRVLEEGYPVTTCSPRFASLVGLPLDQIRLLDLVFDTEAFIMHAQLLCNRAYQSGDLKVSTMCANVCLMPARKRTDRRMYGFSAHLELSMDHNNSAGDVEEWTVRAQFHDVAKTLLHARP
ncbi:unnamed protein product, partial [Prorocentrum cordatum]